MEENTVENNENKILTDDNTEIKSVATIEKKQPIDKDRRFRDSKFISFMIKVAKGIMEILWPTKILYKERFNIEGRAIITCNHYCSIDTNAIIKTYYKKKPFKVILKKELMEGNGFVARFLDQIGGIPIDRGKADIHAVKRALRALKNDEQLIIYPEGTRNKKDTKEMGPIKEGTAMFAIKTQSPIVPMMHYRCAKWYRRNYFIVGHPFTLEEFYNDKSHDVNARATEVIKQKYAELRAEVDEIVEVYHGSVAKYEKAHGLRK